MTDSINDLKELLEDKIAALDEREAERDEDIDRRVTVIEKLLGEKRSWRESVTALLLASLPGVVVAAVALLFQILH